MKLRINFLAMIILAAATAIPVAADEVDPADITQFAAGTPALAEEVNANFAALIAAINDNAQRIEALETAATPLVAGGSYTLATFEALALGSNCSVGPGPVQCQGLDTRRLHLASSLTVLSFNADGTGTGSGVYEEEMLASPVIDSGGHILTHALETQSEADTDNFTFTWSQSGNVVTVQDDAPGEPPFEILMSGNNQVAIIRQVLRGGVEPGSGIDARATQYFQVVGVAVRN